MKAYFNRGSITCDEGHIKLALETLELSTLLAFLKPKTISVSKKTF
jgi:hypothetical protein